MNWTLNSQTFVEGGWERNYVRQKGSGGLRGNSPSRPGTAAAPVNPIANIKNAGFGDFPWIYPDQWVPEEGTLLREGEVTIAKRGGSLWDGERIWTAPRFVWGSRVSPSPVQTAVADDLNSNVWTFNATITRVQGSHTLKAGYFHWDSKHREGQVDNENVDFGQDTSNIYDTTFGFANAATGVFRSFVQGSRWAEGDFRTHSIEFFGQDNWKVNPKLTLDYGLRVVNIIPVSDRTLKAANFLPDRWDKAQAPALYAAGCNTGVYPCAASAREARNPLTGQLLGANSARLIGTRVPGTGSALNGVFPAGKGITDQLYTFPTLAFAPRFGMAWDVMGNKALVVRGGAGVFYDRQNTSSAYDSVKNPPYTYITTIQYDRLQNLKGMTPPESTPTLWAQIVDQKLPTSFQWNSGVQVAVPFSMVLDMAYSGQHAEHQPATGQTGLNINTIDLGTAYLPQYQNPTAASSANMTNPTTSYAATNPNVIRFYQGYGNINRQELILHRTYHSIQLSVNRRFKNGLAFGFFDTISLYDKGNVAPRRQHNADGTVTVRADQAKADELLGNQWPEKNLLRLNFTWKLPTLSAGNGGAKRIIASVVNDWNLSGIWNYGGTSLQYSVAASYQSGGSNVLLTGSPDFAPRVTVLPNVDLGGGCSDDVLHQFNTSAFRGPSAGSVGLESGYGYRGAAPPARRTYQSVARFGCASDSPSNCALMCSTLSIRRA